MKKRTRILLIVAAVVIVLIAGGIYLSQRAVKAAQATLYQMTTLEKGSLTAIVGATGTVHANQTAVLMWQTSGQVERVDVEIGGTVQGAQTLARLKESSLSQSIILAKADLVTARRNLDNLINSNTSQSQAQLTLAQAQKSLDDAKTELNRKDYRRSSDSTLDQARANLILAENALKDAQDFYDQFAKRDDTDLLKAQALSRLASAQQSRDRAYYNLQYLLGKPDQVEVAQAEAQLALAQSRFNDAQREWARLKNGADPDDVAAAQARLSAIEATLNLTHLDAPFGGTVTDVSIKPGDQVTAGTTAFRIDDLSRLLVDVQVPEVDINRVQVGQKATLTFDAILNKEYEGKVTEVGRVGTPSAGVVNFTVTIELSNPDDAVRPGMTAAVNIIVSQLDNVLLVPNRAVRLRDGVRVVYRLVNGVPTPVEITIGSTSDVSSEVISGDVKAGDQILLNPPAEVQRNTTGGRPPF